MESYMLWIFYHSKKLVICDRLDENSGTARSLPKSQKMWNLGLCMSHRSSANQVSPLSLSFYPGGRGSNKSFHYASLTHPERALSHLLSSPTGHFNEASLVFVSCIFSLSQVI